MEVLQTVVLWCIVATSFCGNIIDDVLPCSQHKCCYSPRTDILPNLELSFDCSEPDNLTILTPSSVDKTSFFRLFHASLCTRELPDNICEYPKIVSIRMIHSNITSIPSLSCLKNLIFLDLDGNKIRTLKKDYFRGLSKLRILDLRSNRIDSIEPFTFSDLPDLMIVLLNLNRLKSVEAPWFLSIKHEFCYFGLTHNEIDRFTNVANWQANISEKYGPGMVNFSYNKFSTWIFPQLKIYGVKELWVLATLMRWGFDFRHNPWNCDCKMHQFLATTDNFPEIIWRSYFKVRCQSPPHLEGTLVLDVPLDQFVCNVTQNCPDECFCQDQPQNGNVLVDCRDSNLTKIPMELPSGNLKLLLGDNRISTFGRRYYLSRTTYIDITGNGLKYIQPEVIYLLQKQIMFLNISNNQLKYLPNVIQNIDFSKLSLGNNPFVCDCNSSWMFSWLRQQDTDVSDITCSMSDGRIVQTVETDKASMGCRQSNSVKFIFVIGCCFVFFLIILSLCVVFRFEATIIVYTILKRLQKLQLELDFDVFVSLEEESDAD